MVREYLQLSRTDRSVVSANASFIQDEYLPRSPASYVLSELPAPRVVRYASGGRPRRNLTPLRDLARSGCDISRIRRGLRSLASPDRCRP